MLCDYKWGATCKKHSIRTSTDDNTSSFDERQGWEWLVDSLHYDRIRSTLMQFPIADSLVPAAESDVEFGSTNAKDESNQMDADLVDEIGRASCRERV